MSVAQRSRPVRPEVTTTPVDGRSRRRAFTGERTVWWHQVLLFTLASTLMLVALLVASARFSDQAARAEALNDAEDLTVAVGTFVEPRLTGPLVAGDPAAQQRLRRTVSQRLLGDRMLRTKVWRADGTIVFSDEPRLVGRRFDLDAEELRVLRSGGSDAEASELSEPENVYERGVGELVEVYTQVHDTSGRPLLFEVYFSTADVEARGDVIRAGFRPITIGVLLVFLGFSLPVVALLAHRLGRAGRERERLLQAAVDASDLERRRMVRDLHDGVVQDLAGTAFELAGVAGRTDEATAREVRRLAGQVRGGIRSLRSSLVALYPPDLAEGGLASALGDLLAPATDTGLECVVEVPDDLAVGPEVVHLLWRVASEAVRNALSHASPTRLHVRVVRTARTVVLQVVDDGLGFDVAADSREGHLGMRLLRDLVREHGGDLSVHSGPERGTSVRVEVPA